MTTLIAGYARTPFVKFNGQFKDVPATVLGAHAIGAALSAAGRLAEIGSRLAVSDAGCAAAILRGALEAAALNVLVNTKTMTDRSAADHLNARCFALLDQGRTDGERIFCAVRDQLV